MPEQSPYGDLEDFLKWMAGEKRKGPGPKTQVVRFQLDIIELCPIHGYHVLARTDGGAEYSHN
jgi:hypothetical protein